MRTIVTRAALIAAILFLTGACASSADWAMWRSHSTHFASGEHGFFSMRNNKDGSNPRCTAPTSRPPGRRTGGVSTPSP